MQQGTNPQLETDRDELVSGCALVGMIPMFFLIAIVLFRGLAAAFALLVRFGTFF